MLEIGPGAGVNLRYLTSGKVRWIGVEPNPFMEPYLREEANRLSMPIELHIGTAETLPIADNSVDAAIATLVLCWSSSSTNHFRRLCEVLRPGGRLVFIEHVAPRGSWLRRIQNLPTPIWKRLGYGCNPNRETSVEIERAGFENVTYERIIAPTLILSPQIVGVAKKLPDKGDPFELEGW